MCVGPARELSETPGNRDIVAHQAKFYEDANAHGLNLYQNNR